MGVVNQLRICFRMLLVMLLMCGLLTAADLFEVVAFSGVGSYRSKGSFEANPLVVGEKLQPGCRVRLQEKAVLKLKTPMGDEITLKDSTYVMLSDLVGGSGDTKVKLDMFKGNGRFKVNKLKGESSFAVKTPVAVAGVRGTEFGCRVWATGETLVSVFSGLVAVQDNQERSAPVQVSRGRSARVVQTGEIHVENSVEEGVEERESPNTEMDTDKLEEAREETRELNIQDAKFKLKIKGEVRRL